MDNPSVLIPKLQYILAAASSRLIHLYLSLWNNVLDVLKYQGLANHSTYRYLRQSIPLLDIDLGYSNQDYAQFRALIHNYFIPQFVNNNYQLYTSGVWNVDQKSSWKEYNKVSLTETLTQFFQPEAVNQPRYNGKNPIDGTVFIYWTPFPTEINHSRTFSKPQNLTNITEVEDDIFSENRQKLIKLLGTRITMIDLGLKNMSDKIGYSMLITPVSIKSDDTEIQDKFDTIFEHHELLINPITHMMTFKHELYENQEVKIHGGKIVCPRMSLEDRIVKYMGLNFGQLVLVTRQNRGRLKSDISQQELFMRLIGGDETQN